MVLAYTLNRMFHRNPDRTHRRQEQRICRGSTFDYRLARNWCHLDSFRNLCNSLGQGAIWEFSAKKVFWKANHQQFSGEMEEGPLFTNVNLISNFYSSDEQICFVSENFFHRGFTFSNLSQSQRSTWTRSSKKKVSHNLILCLLL